MASIIRFFRENQKNTQKEYKTAILRDSENTEFKYYELSRTDIMRHDDLRVHIDSASKIICTSNEFLTFTNDSAIIINGILYYIRNIYEEKDDDDNNYFGIPSRKRVYLTLITDR